MNEEIKLRNKLMKQIAEGYDLSVDKLKADCIIDVEEVIDLSITQSKKIMADKLIEMLNYRVVKVDGYRGIFKRSNFIMELNQLKQEIIKLVRSEDD